MCQPLDYGVFGAAKSVFSSLVGEWRDARENRELKLTDFVKILFEVQKEVFTPQTIKNAFKGTGVYPLDEENIHVERCIAHDSPTIQQDIFDENARDGFDDNALTPNTSISELTLTDNNLFDLTSSSADEKLTQMEKLVESLEKEFQSEPAKLVMCTIIKQQVLFLRSSSFSAPIISAPSFSSPSVRATISNVLVRPPAFSRSTQKRNFKMKNYGVMTSDEMLGKYQEIVDNKAKEAEEKETRRVQRLLKRDMNETLRNIKKEADAVKRKRKAEESDEVTFSQPKRRGRPPKTTKISEKENDVDWKPRETRKAIYVKPLKPQNS